MCLYGFYSTRTSVIRRQLDPMMSALIVITDTRRNNFSSACYVRQSNEGQRAADHWQGLAERSRSEK